MNERLETMVSTRRRTQGLAGLRARARSAKTGTDPFFAPTAAQEVCDLCGRSVPDDHRHLLELEQRQILCTCESCWALRSGEPQFAPVGNRSVWIEDFDMPDDVWASFGIPIGLAFFMFSSVTECVVAMYPSPAGATESELHFSDWTRLVERNPVLVTLERDGEALVVNRMTGVRGYAIVPIDKAYELVGLIKLHWEGISGGRGVEEAVASYFKGLRP